MGRNSEKSGILAHILLKKKKKKKGINIEPPSVICEDL